MKAKTKLQEEAFEICLSPIEEGEFEKQDTHRTEMDKGKERVTYLINLSIWMVQKGLEELTKRESLLKLQGTGRWGVGGGLGAIKEENIYLLTIYIIGHRRNSWCICWITYTNGIRDILKVNKP